MTDKEQIYQFIVNSGTVEKVTKKLHSYLRGDIMDYIQDLYLLIFNVPEEKLFSLYMSGKQNLLNYCASICIYNLAGENTNLHKMCSSRQINSVSLDDFINKNYEYDE